MGIKNRLIVMSFLQFFVWGAWLITVSNYWFITRNWSGAEFGAIFSTLGFASLVVKYSTIIMSISQVSETLFILAIPFFLKRFGIKTVMLLSMFAWVLRFAFFAYGDPGGGLWMIVLSCIVYGMAFDFFNISGSLFIETTTDARIRSSAQGLFMMMTNDFGAIFGSLVSGFIIDRYYTSGGTKDWHGIWLSFAIYALVIAIGFSLMFKHQHDSEAVEKHGH